MSGYIYLIKKKWAGLTSYPTIPAPFVLKLLGPGTGSHTFTDGFKMYYTFMDRKNSFNKNIASRTNCAHCICNEGTRLRKQKPHMAGFKCIGQINHFNEKL